MNVTGMDYKQKKPRLQFSLPRDISLVSSINIPSAFSISGPQAETNRSRRITTTDCARRPFWRQ